MEEQADLRPRDVAHILDCCPDDLYPLIYSGEIKATKVGRMWRFQMKDVMDYVKKRNGKPTNTDKLGALNSRRPGTNTKRL